MVTFVSPEWVEDKLSRPGVLILDPRNPVPYLRGHLKGAVNLPLAKLFDGNGRLRSDAEIAQVLSDLGLGDDETPVLYDGFDGQRAALVAWLLEYLGRRDVHIMEVFYGEWTSQGRDIFYRPVKPAPAAFVPRVDPTIRITLAQVAGSPGAVLLDLRSAEEYSGQAEGEGRPGHIPGALSLPWRELVGDDGRFLRADDQMGRLTRDMSIAPGQDVIAYCRTGVRAAVGYLALSRLGYNVKLYDGSYQEWEGRGMPVEGPD